MNKGAILKNVADKLAEVKGSVAVGLVGSAISSENYNDLDFLLMTDNVNSTIQNVRNSFNDCSISRIDDALRIIGFCEKEISIAVHDMEKTKQIIGDFVSGKNATCEHSSWALGYRLPEGFAFDISRIQILKDTANQLRDLKTKVQTYSPYARKKILSDCIEETEIKTSILDRGASGIEKSMLENDIRLCQLRSHFAKSSQYLKGFKGINGMLETLTPPRLDDLKNQISWTDNLYMGTWQFGGGEGFKQLSDDEIRALLQFAKKQGIRKFDTALVYGKGNVEKLLGEITTHDDTVVTKIPAKTKPDPTKLLSLDEYYSQNHIKKCVEQSLSNLNRGQLNTVLLHNWLNSWSESDLISWLSELKEKGLAQKVGISLPNGFNSELPQSVLERIDVVEAPYNVENRWIQDSLELYKSFGKEIILRSLFNQGKNLNGNNQPFQLIQNAKKLGTSLVVGMTTNEQIKNNTETLARLDK